MESSILAAVDELIVDMTNIIRMSEAAHHLFTGSDEAEDFFDIWQADLLKAATVVLTTWTLEDTSCEEALETFRVALTEALPRASRFKHTF